MTKPADLLLRQMAAQSRTSRPWTADALAKAGAALLGCAATAATWQLLQPPAQALVVAPATTRVAVRLAGPRSSPGAESFPTVKPPPQSAKVTRIQAPQPLRPKPPMPPEPPNQQPLPPAIADSASGLNSSLATLSQPPLQVPSAPVVATAAKPPLGAQVDAPPAPGEGEAARDYPEQPGGNVLVLGMLINASGKVLDTRVLVPSFNSLANLSVAMAALGKTWTDIEPPLAPNETRWVELRIPFQDPLSRPSILP